MPRESALKGASRGAEQLLNAVIARKQLDLEGRRVTAFEQNSAMSRLVTLSPFMPRDVAIKDLPELHNTLSTAIPEFDLSEEGGIGSSVLRESTFDDLVRPLLTEGLANLKGDARTDISERMVARVALGTPEGPQELAARGVLAETTVDAFTAMMKDPEAKLDMYRNAAGLQPIVRFTDPRDGTERMFSTNSSASIWARLSEQYDYMNFEREKMSSKQMLDVAEELMEQLKNHDVSLGRPQAMKILQMYEQSVMGDYEPGQSPLDAYYRKIGQDPEVKTAIEVFTGAVRFGDSALEEYLRGSPTGVLYLRFKELAESAVDFVPKDEVLDFLESVSPMFPGIATYEGADWLGRKGKLIFPAIGDEAPAAADALRIGGAEGLGDVGGLPSMDELEASMREDAKSMARGTMTLRQVNAKYPDLVRRRLIIQVAMEMIASGEDIGEGGE